MAQSGHRLQIVDALRGMAALWVSFCHLLIGAPQLTMSWADFARTHGIIGVYVFFVISGFVIPYSMRRSGYQIGDYGVFLLKRIIRLDPPYLVAVLLALVLGYAGAHLPGHAGQPFHASWPQVLLHIGYLTGLFGYPWLNMVFWTLGIELQYYLLVGLIFRGIAHASFAGRAGTFLALGVLGLLGHPQQFLSHWIFSFMMGMATFQYFARIGRLPEFLAWSVLFGAAAWHVNGPLAAMTALGTSSLILLWRMPMPQMVLFCGTISYSLYLLHNEVGRRVVTFGVRFADTTPKVFLVLMLGFAVALLAAWLLNRYVEQPAMRWAASIRYRRPKSTAAQ